MQGHGVASKGAGQHLDGEHQPSARAREGQQTHEWELSRAHAVTELCHHVNSESSQALSQKRAACIADAPVLQ